MTATADDIRAQLRERLQDCSQAELATDLGISATYLNDVLHSKKEPGAGILVPLGLRRVVTYERVSQASENVAAIRLRLTADEMDGAANALADVGTPEAKAHAQEMRGAAKLARGWARELTQLYNAKIRARGEIKP